MSRPSDKRPRYAPLARLLKPVMGEIARATRRGMTELDEDYAEAFHVSAALVRAWRTGQARPATDDIIVRLARDAVLHAKVDAAWCSAFFGTCDVPHDFALRLINELFSISAAQPTPKSALLDHSAPFLAPPLPPQPIIGRENALLGLARTVRGSAATAIAAMRGLPGVGKTTLAVALAHTPEIRAHFCDGVLWVGLGRNPDISDGLRRWANALALDVARFERLPSEIARVEALHDQIGARRMLLVVDDAWTAEAALVFRLGGPNCAHLLTTRFSGIAHDFALGNITTVEELSITNGVRLFSSIAQRVASAEPIETRRIIALVGGLPLAVTLAARTAWKLAEEGNAMPASALLAQLVSKSGLDLAQPFAPLERTPSLVGAAAISLDAIIRLSFDALTDAERHALVSLSSLLPKPTTFSGAAGCEVGACDIDDLNKLVNWGLVETSGSDRFAIHQTVADFASRRRVDDAAHRRVVEHYLGVAKTHTREFAVLDREMTNIQHAINVARALQFREFRELVNWLYRFFQARGQHARGLPLAREAYEFSKTIGDEEGIAWSAMNIGNYLRLYRADFVESEKWLREAGRLFRQQNNLEKFADATLVLGFTLQEMNQLDEAKALFHEVLEIGEEIRDDSFIAEGWNSLGVNADRRADNDGAIEYYERALVIARRNNLSVLLATILSNLGLRVAQKGDMVLARSRFEESVGVCQSYGLTQRCYLSRMDWAVTEAASGDLDEAEYQFKAALALARQTGSHRNISEVTRELGKLCIKRQLLTEAMGLFEDSLASADADNLDDNRAATLFEIAKLSFAREHYDLARIEANRSLALWHKLSRSQQIGEVSDWLDRIPISPNDH